MSQQLTETEWMEKLFGKQESQEFIIADRSPVQRYAECPFAAWYCREHGIDVPNVPKDVGNETHALAEGHIKDALDTYTPPEDIAANIVDALPSVRPDIQPKVIRAARYLAESVAHIQMHNVIGVEIQIDDGGKSGLRNIEGIPFKLTLCLDLLFSGRQSLIVYDWKSGFKKRTKDEVFDDFQCQFGVYLLWMLYPDIDVVHWFFDETFYGSKAYARFERNAEYPSLPHLTQEMQFKGRIFEALRLWQEDCRQAWPEQKKCAWCDIVLDCPHANAGAKRIASNPRKFIDRMTAMEAALDKYASIAKDWYKRCGPIQGTKMVFDWRPSRRFSPKLYVNKNGDNA
jgi:hypothetical protein